MFITLPLYSLSNDMFFDVLVNTDNIVTVFDGTRELNAPIHCNLVGFHQSLIQFKPNTVPQGYSTERNKAYNGLVPIDMKYEDLVNLLLNLHKPSCKCEEHDAVEEKNTSSEEKHTADKKQPETSCNSVDPINISITPEMINVTVARCEKVIDERRKSCIVDNATLKTVVR